MTTPNTPAAGFHHEQKHQDAVPQVRVSEASEIQAGPGPGFCGQPSPGCVVSIVRRVQEERERGRRRERIRSWVYLIVGTLGLVLNTWHSVMPQLEALLRALPGVAQ